jgi:hypothetical protein
MRRLVVASAILAILLAMPLAVAAAPNAATPATDSERATAALRFLWTAQQPDGSLDKSLGETADFVIGAAAAGYDPATLLDCSSTATALDYLATASDAKATDAANTGKTILAVVAAGGDPSSFKGRDFTARLAALYHSATGEYGDGTTFSQSFGILAAVASGGTVPKAAKDALKALQDSDGSWSYGAAAVPAGQGDSNSTAIALMALDATKVNSLDAAALKYLATQQVGDGGFAYSTAWGSASDPDSDSIVLQALVAAGQDPEGTGWLQGGNSVLTHLRASQAVGGGFAYPGGAPDAFTTSQVPSALVRVQYAAEVHWTPGRSLPAIECPSPSPSPTPTPTPSPSPSPTPSPTATPAPTPTPTTTAAPTTRPTARPTVKPAVKPIATVPAVSTVPPTESPVQTDAAAPTASQTRTEDMAAVDASAAAEKVAAVTLTPGSSSPTPSDPSVPTPLLYGAVAVLGLAVVLGGGWLYINRPWIR